MRTDFVQKRVPCVGLEQVMHHSQAWKARCAAPATPLAWVRRGDGTASCAARTLRRLEGAKGVVPLSAGACCLASSFRTVLAPVRTAPSIGAQWRTGAKRLQEKIPTAVPSVPAFHRPAAGWTVEGRSVASRRSFGHRNSTKMQHEGEGARSGAAAARAQRARRPKRPRHHTHTRL
jgi:hypothetical protein